MNDKINMLDGINKKKDEKRKINLYIEEDMFSYLLYIAEISGASMTSTANILLKNAIKQAFEQNGLEFDATVVDRYNEKIKNRVKSRD